VVTIILLIHGSYSSEADPEVLSDYIIALLKHNRSLDDLRSLCLDKLKDFLKHGKIYKVHLV
jgi:RNA-binding protein 26